MITDEELDLGWKAAEDVSSMGKRRKGKKKVDPATTALVEANERARHVASTVSALLSSLRIGVFDTLY